MHSFFSLPVSALADAAPTADSIYEALTTSSPECTALLLAGAVVSLMAPILIYWLASKVVTKTGNGFGEAFKLWIYYVISFIAVTIFAYALSRFGFQKDSGAIVLITLAISSVLGIIITFAAPMSVYKIDFGRALGFIAICFVLNSATQLATLKLLNSSSVVAAKLESLSSVWSLSVDERGVLFKRMIALIPGFYKPSDDDIAADATKPRAVREAAMKRIYADLEKRRAALKPEDAAALADYNKHDQRYRELLEMLQAEPKR